MYKNQNKAQRGYGILSFRFCYECYTLTGLSNSVFCFATNVSPPWGYGILLLRFAINVTPLQGCRILFCYKSYTLTGLSNSVFCFLQIFHPSGVLAWFWFSCYKCFTPMGLMLDFNFFSNVTPIWGCGTLLFRFAINVSPPWGCGILFSNFLQMVHSNGLKNITCTFNPWRFAILCRRDSMASID